MPSQEHCEKPNIKPFMCIDIIIEKERKREAETEEEGETETPLEV